jgi:ribonuclease III
LYIGKQLKKWLGVQEQAISPVDVKLNKVLTEVENIISYKFNDKKLLERALVHRSHLHSLGADRIESNERLEFLGDSVLGLAVNEYLYNHFPEKNEGDLTKMKSSLVCGTTLAKVALSINLGNYITMSHGEATTGGRERSSILADTVEALLGAVYLDSGMITTKGVVNHLVLMRVDSFLDENNLTNSKSRLQEILQAKFKTPPHYKLVEASGPDHERIFTIKVSFKGVVLGVGTAGSKKDAEQTAASNALTKIENDPSLLPEEQLNQSNE